MILRVFRDASVALVLSAIFLCGAGVSGLGVVPVSAQTVTGRVTDVSDGTALVGASVVVRGTGTGVATDRRGTYRLALPAPGAYTLVVRFLGYETQSVDVTVRAGSTERSDVKLQPVVLGADELVVVGTPDVLTASARSTETLDARALADARGQTFGETLAALPGVTTLSTGPTIDKPVVRGLHSERVVLVQRGVRQEGQQWGREHAPEVDPFAPVEITVVKGAAGVEYGAGAIGGVLRLEPRELPTTPGLQGAVDVDAFTNNGQGAGSVLVEGAGLSGADGGTTWSGRVQGSFRKAAASRAPEYVIGNTGFEERNGFAAGKVTSGRWTGEVSLSRFDAVLGIFSGAHVNTISGLEAAIERGRPAVDYDYTYAVDAPRQRVTHDLATASAAVDLSTGDRVEVRYGLQHNHRREYDAHGPGGDVPDLPGVDLRLVTHTVDATWRSRPLGPVAQGDVMLVAGLSGMNQGNTNGRSSYLIPNYRALSGGAFARSTWVRDDWTLDAGLRLDRQWSRSFPRADGRSGFEETERSFTGGSGVLSATWRVAPQWSVSAAASTAWRPPGFNELYSDGVHHGTAQFEAGNPRLDAERAWSLDATVRHAGPRVRLQVGAYETRVSDFIHLIPTGDPVVTIRGVFPEFAYRQSAVSLRGIDGRAEVDVLRPLTVGATASIVRATDRDLDRPLIDMPADRGSVFAEGRLWQRSQGWLREAGVRAEAHLVRKQTRVPEGVDFAPPPSGYQLVDLSLRATFGRGPAPATLRLGVDNVFNTAYRDYLDRLRYFTDAPGRTLTLRVHVPF
jgi:iron complex outermembrane receptor protein